MKTKLSVTAISLGLIISPLAHATASSTKLQREIKQINAEMKNLQHEVSTLKTQLKQAKTKAKVAASPAAESAAPVQAEEGFPIMQHGPLLLHESANHQFIPMVTTSPFLGARTAYNASDLLTNFSSINEDLAILQNQQKVDQELGYSLAQNRPRLEISGTVQTLASLRKPYQTKTTSDLNLSYLELDLLAHASPWAHGLVAITYNAANLPTGVMGAGYRVGNSDVFINRAFITFGNLDKSPIYFTMGQIYVPFGSYSSVMVANPLTKDFARTNERAVLLGFSSHGFYGQTYAFKGDAYVSNNTMINNWGANLGYFITHGLYSAKMDAGFIQDIADSQGFQFGSSNFAGFGAASATEKLDHRVPAYDVNTQLTAGPFALIGEYIATVRSFAYQNFGFNGHGARPSVLHLEADYNFRLLGDKPSSVGLSYAHTWQALGLAFPEQQFTATFNTSIFKDTVESVEYQHGLNYSSSDSYYGPGLKNNVNSVGGYQNSIVAQIALYF